MAKMHNIFASQKTRLGVKASLRMCVTYGQGMLVSWFHNYCVRTKILNMPHFLGKGNV